MSDYTWSPGKFSGHIMFSSKSFFPHVILIHGPAGWRSEYHGSDSMDQVTTPVFKSSLEALHFLKFIADNINHSESKDLIDKAISEWIKDREDEAIEKVSGFLCDMDYKLKEIQRGVLSIKNNPVHSGIQEKLSTVIEYCKNSIEITDNLIASITDNKEEE